MTRSRSRLPTWVGVLVVCVLAAGVNDAIFVGLARVTPQARWWEVALGQVLREQASLLAAEQPVPQSFELVALPPSIPAPVATQAERHPPAHAVPGRSILRRQRMAVAERTPPPVKSSPVKPPPAHKKKRHPAPVLAQNTPKPPPPPPPPVRPPPQIQPPAHRLMAELDDNTDDGPNPDAKILAEHNHKVAVQTVARERNLEHEDHVQQQSSRSSHIDAPQEGGEKDKVAELETTKPPAPGQQAVVPHGNPEAPRAARGQAAPGPLGTGAVGPLSMRDPPPQPLALKPQQGLVGSGQGDLPAPVTASVAQPAIAPPAGKAGSGGGGGLGQYKLNLTTQDYDHIFGSQAVAERQRGASEQSSTPGRWDKKWAIARSSLENYVADVRPGNQTALNTAAAPFAAFIAAMHRQIHPIFADGFLADLDAKPTDSPFDDMSLWTNLEIVLDTDGTVDKITVVKPSGFLPFDAEAIDAVMTAAPFPPPPSVIWSANHKVYLHWGFYRNQRACGTFNAEPYILTTPPAGPHDTGPGAAPTAPPMPRAAPGGDARAAQAPTKASPAAAPIASTLDLRPDDPGAVAAVDAFADALAAGRPGALTRASGLPFSSAGAEVATTAPDLLSMYAQLTREIGPGQKVESVKLYSAAQIRRALGRLPQSGDDAVPALYAVVDVGGSRFVLVVRRDESAAWKVFALDR